MQTVERLRTEQLERLRAEHGTDGIIRLLAYTEDDSAWGAFLSFRLNEREYSLIAHRASEIEKRHTSGFAELRRVVTIDRDIYNASRADAGSCP